MTVPQLTLLLAIFSRAICFMPQIYQSRTRPAGRRSHRHRFLPACMMNTDPLMFPEPFEFLGRGPAAIVRPGIVLVAPKHEYSHFLMKSAIFVFAMGYDEEEVGVIRAVSLDNPTAFTMNEMSSLPGVLGSNIMFRGGDRGNDSAMMLHSCGALVGENSADEMIGSSGVYEGGLDAAMKLVDAEEADPEWFKFFFNYLEFTESELEQILTETDSEGDAWVSLSVPSSFVLYDHDKNEAWSKLRNKVRLIQE
mmetsp:Transcript_8303/g.12346  ORF Transcript_8303/g.12346 Transcript_8303/m.12346 type:complete len:251 (+) Transcript_8303:34-786(+)